MNKAINPAAIKALAIDLDGTTLLPDGSIGRRTVQCLQRCMRKGAAVIVCTGRALEASVRYIDAIGARGPMVFFNGAEVIEVPGGTNTGGSIISARLLSSEAARAGLEIARSMNVHYQVFVPSADGSGNGRETLYIEKVRDESNMYHNHTGITPVVADIAAVLSAPGVKGCAKAMFISDPALHAEIRQKMLIRFGDGIYMAATYPPFLEVMNAGVSKGEGLKTVMQCLGLRPHEVIAFGDEENDLPMFAAAGFSAAPSNARESVRNAADFVFGSNADEGLAVFLEGLFGEE